MIRYTRAVSREPRPRISPRRQPMDAAAVHIRFRDAETRLVSAELQLDGTSPHEWKHAPGRAGCK